MNHLARAREVFDIEIAALKAVRTQLDGAFEAADRSPSRASGKSMKQ